MANTIWASLEQSGLGTTIASNEWMFPTIETIHVFALVTVIGAIAIMDLRLLGLTSKNRSVKAVERDTVPVTWIGFAVALITGLLLFVSKATTYMANPYFLWKMGLMAVAGVNMAIFHRILSQGIDEWGKPGGSIPAAAKLSGALSLGIWLIIPVCGRVIGFTLGVYY
ncbi:MAG TPA: DUF6644 family protein [Sphingomonadaceae bacterium]|nr:DUF6644 family protein [Sphingomonadaceae bacterium]